MVVLKQYCTVVNCTVKPIGYSCVSYNVSVCKFKILHTCAMCIAKMVFFLGQKYSILHAVKINTS